MEVSRHSMIDHPDCFSATQPGPRVKVDQLIVMTNKDAPPIADF
jgi:hypothetical protein